MFDKSQPRIVHIQHQSHERTFPGLAQSNAHRSSLSASGALLSTHRAIIQASYRTLRPSAQSRSHPVTAPGNYMQPPTTVSMKSPSLCLPGHPSRNIPGSCHLPFHGPYSNQMSPLPMWATQPYSTRPPAAKKPPPSPPAAVRKPQHDCSTLTAHSRQDALHKTATRHTSASGSQHVQPPNVTIQVKHKKAGLPLQRMPSFRSLAQSTDEPQETGQDTSVTDPTPPELSSSQASRPCRYQQHPTQTCHGGSCGPSGAVRRASVDNVVQMVSARAASARSLHLQQYLETQPSSVRHAVTANRDRGTHPNADVVRGSSHHAERLQWQMPRQTAGPQLRSAFAELLPIDPLTAVLPSDRVTSSNPGAGAGAAVQRRPSTVPNMSRVSGCTGTQDAVRPGTSAGVSRDGLAGVCIGPWGAEVLHGCSGVADESGAYKVDAEKGRDRISSTEQGDGLGFQYAGWVWGPGSTPCLHGAKVDKRNSGQFDRGRDLDEWQCDMDSVCDRSKLEASRGAQEDDESMLTCASVEINALLMFQILRAGDKRQ